MALRDAGTQPLAFLSAAAQAGHVGRRAGLVNEDEFAGIEFELVLEPGLAPLQDVGPIPLRRVRGLFLNVRPQRSRKVQMVPTLALTQRSVASRCCISTIVRSGV